MYFLDDYLHMDLYLHLKARAAKCLARDSPRIAQCRESLLRLSSLRYLIKVQMIVWLPSSLRG